MTRSPNSEALRHRLAIAVSSGALAAGLVYVLERAFIHLRFGSAVPLLVVRERFVGFYQALAIAACFGVLTALVVIAMTHAPQRRAKLESALLHSALPLVALGALAALLFP